MRAERERMKNPVEAILGAVVLLVAAFFLMFAYTTSGFLPVRGHLLRALFAKVGGLHVGADVRIAGVKVGTVTGQSLNPATFEAVVDMTVLPDVHLPQDTVAAITSESLLGGKYVQLEPGHSAETLIEGDTITATRSYKSVEEMVSEIIFLATQGGDTAR